MYEGSNCEEIRSQVRERRDSIVERKKVGNPTSAEESQRKPFNWSLNKIGAIKMELEMKLFGHSIGVKEGSK